MNFIMENFKMGVNKNGFHFRDSESGVIFTLLEERHNWLDIAICRESASEEVCAELESKVKQEHSSLGLFVKEKYKDILLDKCYLNEEQDLFAFEFFGGDGIGIRHLKTGKIPGLLRITDGVPEVAISFGDDYYGYEEVIKDFFTICFSEIKEIAVIVNYHRARISRKDSIRRIKEKLVNLLSKEIEEQVLSESDVEEIKVTSEESIIKTNKLSQTFKHRENGWYVDAMAEEYPVRGLICAIDAVKKFPEIDKCVYSYKFNGRSRRVYITKEN